MAKINLYTVVVGNIGTVYDGKSKQDANDAYKSYVWDSRHNQGRGAGEPVTLFLNDDPHLEYDPKDDPKRKPEWSVVKFTPYRGNDTVYCGMSKMSADAYFRTEKKAIKDEPDCECTVTMLKDGIEFLKFDPAVPEVKPVKPIKWEQVPAEIWVMAYHTHNALGSIAHVSGGDKFWPTREACQKEIDEMKGWIGMGDRSQYRPLQLKRG